MAQDIIDGINPTRMELLNLKDRTKLAVKGHGLLKEKRDALIKEFFDILDRVKGVRDQAESSLKEANESLISAQIVMGDLAVSKASLSVKESIDVDITSRSIMGVSVPVTKIKMDKRSLIDRGYGFSDTTIQLDEAAKKFEESLKLLIELGEIEKTIFLLAEEIESTKRRVNALEHIMIPRFENTVKSIDMRLQEMERENFVRLKMIRSTIEKSKKSGENSTVNESNAEEIAV
jgi:V/A-type H+-transporting ATPase subunit D